MATEVMVGVPLVEDRSDRSRRRRRGWLAWLMVILAIFLCLFACGQASLLGANANTDGMASGSAMGADYTAWQGWSFGPLLPQIVLEAIRDLGTGDGLTVATSTTCLLGSTCPTGTPLSPSRTPPGGPSATPTGGASPTPVAPTRTSTPVTTATHQPATSTPTVTPTPTPLVYPVKLANPVNIPPGAAAVQFTIMVINYGNPTGAELTEVIDRLPPEMSYAGGCNPAGCVVVGNEVRWSGSWMIAQGSYRTFRFDASVAGTLAGDVLTNEVETHGGNFNTAVNVRRVYVYTPTPTATPTEIPIANDDSAATNEDTPVTIDVLANDTNLRDVNLTLTSSDPPRGSVSFVNNPGIPLTLRLVYTPDPNWSGTDVFTYRVTDRDGDFDTATVTVVVAPVNDVPNANDDAFNVNEDILTPLNVLLNDSGLGDTPLSLQIIATPSPGTAVVIGSPGAAPFIRYLSGANYNGPDSLTYRVCDPGDQVTGDGLIGTADDECDTAILNLNVLPVNDRPVAVGDNAYIVTEDQVLDTALLVGPPPPNPSVLDNDVDVDTVLLQARLPVFPLTSMATANGAVALGADGRFVYTPRANFFGTDTFTYWAFDGALYSAAPATVRITVIDDPDDIPAAADDSYSIAEDTPTLLAVLANDLGVVDIPVSVTILDAPDHGAAAVQIINGGLIPPDIQIWYSPLPNQHSGIWGGPDELTYQVCDDDLECDTAVVTITVNAVHDPPTTVADAYSMVEDQIATFLDPSVLVNDLPPGDLPIDPATVCIVGRACPIMGFPLGVAGGRITDIDPATGRIEFEPNDDFNGVVAFDYTVADSIGARSPAATVTISVLAQNDVPVAIDDQAHTVLGATIFISVLANDIGIGDIPLTLTVVPPIPAPSDGVCSVVGSQIRFVPGPAFAGTVQCGYRVTDADGEWDEATISIYVNRPPVAVDDAPPPINEDVTLVVDVLANDSDLDDGLDPATVAIMDAPDHGSILAIDPATGEVTYVPDWGYHGTDSFTYRVRDLHVPPAWSNIARVDITINSVNTDPDAQPDSAFTQQDVPVTIDVLTNDSDPDVPPDPLTITGWVDPGPPGGIDSSIVLDDNGTPDPSDDTLIYTPGSGVWGTEILTYTIDDGAGGTDTTTVSVRVNGWPTAMDDTATTAQDVSADIAVLANDTDPDSPPGGWRVIAVTDPPHGSTAINAGLTVVYTPDVFYQGGDSFSYTMTDGEGGTASATVTMTVLEADDAPVARDDPGAGPALQVGEGQTISVAVLANDLGLGDAPFTVVAGPASFPGCAVPGTLNVIGSGGPAAGIRVEYTAPDQECAGAVTFDYTVTDGDVGPYLPAEWDTATVTVTVIPVNDPPIAVPDSGATDEDTSVLIDVATNDTDVESVVADPTTVAIASCPGGAACVANGDGTVTYTPGANFFGVTTFTYTIDDDQGATSSPGTVTVVVNSINDPPQANDDSRSTNQGVPVTINAAANDSDVEGGLVPSSAQLVAGPSNGSVINNGDGSFTYFPNVGPFLNDSFTYQVWDIDGAASNVATVSISINKPDLVLVKDGPSAASPGEEIWFFLTVANNGPGTAFSVSLSDTLGDCFTWLDPPPTGSLGDLAEGEGRVISSRARVRDPLPPSCDNTNEAEVSAANADSGSETLTVDLGVPITGMAMMMAIVEETPTATPTGAETATPVATEPTSTETTEAIPSPVPTDPLETATAAPTDPLETATAAPTDPGPAPTLTDPTATDPPEPIETPAPTDSPHENTPAPTDPPPPPEDTPAPSDPPAPPPEESPPPPPEEPSTEPQPEPVAAILTSVRWDRQSRRPLWGGTNGLYMASDGRWLLGYLFNLFAPPGTFPVSPTPMPGR
jgi:uncharacterized repeat protein (TIGR01451 family)